MQFVELHIVKLPFSNVAETCQRFQKELVTDSRRAVVFHVDNIFRVNTTPRSVEFNMMPKLFVRKNELRSKNLCTDFDKWAFVVHLLA